MDATRCPVGRGCTATYCAVIAERRRRKKHALYPEPPEEKYIAFATNVPDVGLDRYRWRWNIEAGYRLLEQGSAKTWCRAPAARMFCFMYTCLFYDAWIIVRALMSGAYLLTGSQTCPTSSGGFAELSTTFSPTRPLSRSPRRACWRACLNHICVDCDLQVVFNTYDQRFYCE